jgi:PTS system nitrogen regulatory IIA component
MEIRDLLAPERVIANLKVTSKKQALQELSKKFAAAIGRDEREIFDLLLERERLGTTGVGDGIAIPHGKLASLDQLYGMFARLERPVNFESIDERPVDLIFLLLAPESAGADHLKALARISRLLRDKKICEKLRGSDTPEALYALLTEQTTSRAA